MLEQLLISPTSNLVPSVHSSGEVVLVNRSKVHYVLGPGQTQITVSREYERRDLTRHLSEMDLLSSSVSDRKAHFRMAQAGHSAALHINAGSWAKARGMGEGLDAFQAAGLNL